MGDPFALRGVDPRMAAFAQFAEDPAAAVVASGGGNSILFPRQPSAGILTPEDQAMIKRNTLLHIAAGLLMSGGRSPNQQGTLTNIGSALAGIDLPGATQSALRMRAAVDELNQRANARATLQEIVARHPPIVGENREQKFNRLTDMVIEAAGVPGLEDWIGKTSNVLAQLRPPREGRLIRSVEVGTSGKPEVVFRDPETGAVVQTGGEAPPPSQYFVDDQGNVHLALGAQGVPVPGAQGKTRANLTLTEAERRSAEQVIRAFKEQNRLEDTDAQAGVKPTIAAVAEEAGRVPVIGGLLHGIAAPAAQKALTPSQAEFRRAAVTARHHYQSLLAHTRGALGIIADIDKATSAPAGETRPEVLASYRQARQEIIDQLEAALGHQIDLPAAPSAPAGSPVAPPGAPAPVPVNPRWWRNK